MQLVVWRKIRSKGGECNSYKRDATFALRYKTKDIVVIVGYSAKHYVPNLDWILTKNVTLSYYFSETPFPFLDETTSFDSK